MDILILTILLSLSLTGISICRLILLHLMNRDSPLGAKLCSNKGNFNCDKVLGSGLGRISKNIHLGDAGLVYFISQFLFLIFESINGRVPEGIGILTFPCLLSVALTFVSLAYQAFRVKAWCKMCLITTGIIWLQGLTLLANFSLRDNSPRSYFAEIVSRGKWLPSLLTFLVSLLIAGAWFLIRGLIATAGEVKILKGKLLLLKKDSNVFRAVLKRQRTVNTDLWEDEFLLGSIDAPVQLVLALNPFCQPCAREYREILGLLHMFPGFVRVAIRFLVNSDTESKPTRVARYLLHRYAYMPRNEQPHILENWFNSPSLNQLEKLYPDIDPDGNELLKKHQQWFEESKITHTPTLFIHGHEFPKLYTLSDLILLIPKLSKRPLKTSPVK
jgi:hypothetical protein